VELFDKCPLAWRLTKLDHVPQAPAAPLIFGDAIHQALYMDGRAYMLGAPRMGLDDLVYAFSSGIEARLWLEDPGKTLILQAQRDDMHKDARAIFAGYVEHVQPFYFPLAVEQWFGQDPVIPIPDAPGWTFTGILDARVKIGALGHGILDFKTGKPWPAGAEHGKPQASAYLWADQQRPVAIDNPALFSRASFVMFILLPVVDGACVPQLRTTRRQPADLHAYAEHLAIVAREIDEAKASGDFTAKTGPLCAYCGCLGSCETGQDWLRSKGRESHVPGVTL
jgi:hypothetical protein